jgi:Concanavalin A-like lectin/glucanases superfamily/Domain of unknown function (DUF2341)
MRPFILIILSNILLLSCSSNVMEAGSSVSGNGRVSGCLVHQNGVPAPHAQVMILSISHNPVLDAPLPNLLIDTTDAQGIYAFEHVDSGAYDILAVGLDERTRALIKGIRVDGDSVKMSSDTLREPGTIKVMLPDSVDIQNGYVYIPGTTISAPLRNSSGFVLLDSVPSGILPPVSYIVKTSLVQKVIRYDVRVTSGDTSLIAMPAWKYAEKVILNTTASGANASGNVTGFPVLIRLTNSNFDFSQAAPAGGDIRFTKQDNTPIPYEIERWNAAANAAEIWVKFDTVFGNDSSHFVTMYWGASTASATVSLSNGAAVFDTLNGFQGVWHLNEASGSTAKDATANRFDGVSPPDSSPVPVAGAIGLCREFNGISNYIQMHGTASGKLNFPEKGAYSVAAWVYIDTVDTAFYKIVEKNDRQYKLQKNGERKSWEFSEYENATGYELSTTPASANAWVFLVGVRNGGSQYLYVNGQCVANTVVPIASNYGRDTTCDVTIGRNASLTFGPLYFFKGKIDEARIENRARSADWIKLCFMNQKAGDALVVFKP